MAEHPIFVIVTPPGWYDPSVVEFAAICKTPVRSQHSMIDIPGLDYDDLNAIAGTEPQIARAAHLLGLASASVVGMTGTPFVWTGLDAEAASSKHLLRDTLRLLAGEASDAETFVSLGSGVRTLAALAALEGELGRPLVASDTALYWAMARSLLIPLRSGAVGRLGECR
ncbi:MAG: hypothetical protein AAF367_20605 [Pseudomonadota bacterium]